MDIPYEEVHALAGGEMVGRPHFARLMVEKGYVQSIQDAFNRFLAKGAPAYVEKLRLSPESAIDLIHRAGGVAVLAHPYQLKLASLDATDGLVAELTGLGLDGIEAIYSRHSEEQRAAYAEIARRHSLVITGGSDYHGTYKPDLNLVTGKGDLSVPYECLEEIKARARSRKAH
jgi:predicted metal-dependent phosphoesterase TrpH